MKKSLCFLFFVFLLLASGCAGPIFTTTITFAPDTTVTVSPNDMLQAGKVLQKRLEAELSGKSRVQLGSNSLTVSLSKASDLSLATELATRPGLIVFFQSSTPIAEGQPVPAEAPIILTGADIQHANVELVENRLAIALKLTEQGKTKLAEFTKTHIGTYLVIARDNMVISSPKINSAITGGSAMIEGNFDETLAKFLATLINSGALPVPLKVEK